MTDETLMSAARAAAQCTQESGTCTTCRAGCTRKPGWFLPGEAEKAAVHLGMTLQEFFDAYLAVDWWEGEPDIFLLSPSIVGEDTGTEFPGNPGGACVFYKEGRCQIHEVKPFECRDFWCGSPGLSTVHHDTAHAWAAHQGQIRGLLGREPKSAAYEGGGLLGWLGW